MDRIEEIMKRFSFDINVGRFVTITYKLHESKGKLICPFTMDSNSKRDIYLLADTLNKIGFERTDICELDNRYGISILLENKSYWMFAEDGISEQSSRNNVIPDYLYELMK